MSNAKKISELPAAAPLVGTEPLALVQSGATRKATAQDVAALKQVTTPNYAYVEKTDTETVTSSSGWQSTGLSLTITTQDAASKVELLAVLAVGSSRDFAGPYFRFVRSSTVLLEGDTAGNRTPIGFPSSIVRDETANDVGLGTAVGMLTDAPGIAGSHTYEIEWRMSLFGNGYLNRSDLDIDGGDYARGASTFRALEILP